MVINSKLKPLRQIRQFLRSNLIDISISLHKDRLERMHMDPEISSFGQDISHLYRFAKSPFILAFSIYQLILLLGQMLSRIFVLIAMMIILLFGPSLVFSTTNSVDNTHDCLDTTNHGMR